MEFPEEIVAKILSKADMMTKKSALTVDKNFNKASEYDSVWETVTFINPMDISVFKKYGKFMKNVTFHGDVCTLVEIIDNDYLTEVTTLFVDIFNPEDIPTCFGEILSKLNTVENLEIHFGNVLDETTVYINLPQLKEVFFIEEDFNSPMVNIIFTAPVYKYLTRLETIVDNTNVPYAPNAKYLNLETCFNGYNDYNFKDMDIDYLSVGVDFSFSQYSGLYNALSSAKNIKTLHLILYGEDISIFRKFDKCKSLDILFSVSSRNISLDYDVIENIDFRIDTQGDEAFVSILNVPINNIECVKNIEKSDNVILSLINMT